MRLPRAPDVLAALLVGTVSWSAWPWWSAQADAWLPTLPAALGLVAAYVLFRFALAPVRATFALLLGAGAASRPKPSSQARP